MGFLTIACLLLPLLAWEASAQGDQQARQIAQQFGNRDQCLFGGQSCGRFGGSCSCSSNSNIIIVVIIQGRQQRRNMGRNCFCRTRPRNPPLNPFSTPCGFFRNGRQRLCHNRCQFCNRRGRFQQCARTNARGCLDLGFDETEEQVAQEKQQLQQLTQQDEPSKFNENAPIKAEKLATDETEEEKEPEVVSEIVTVETKTSVDVMSDELKKLAASAEKAIEEGIEKSQLEPIEQAKKNLKAIEEIATNIMEDETALKSPQIAEKKIKETEIKEGAKADDETETSSQGFQKESSTNVQLTQNDESRTMVDPVTGRMVVVPGSS